MIQPHDFTAPLGTGPEAPFTFCTDNAAIKAELDAAGLWMHIKALRKKQPPGSGVVGVFLPTGKAVLHFYGFKSPKDNGFASVQSENGSHVAAAVSALMAAKKGLPAV